MKKSYLLIAVLLSFLFGCDTPTPETNEEPGDQGDEPEVAYQSSIEKRTNMKWKYVLGNELNETNLSGFNHFGDFFDGRAKFYINDQLDVKIGGTDSKKITLCFLDESLCNVKYAMDHDISSYLLKKLGKCKIKGLDSLTTARIKKGKLLHKSDSGLHLAPDLQHFQLRWDKGNVEAIYTVNYKDLEAPTYAYTERIADFKENLLFLEKFRHLGL